MIFDLDGTLVDTLADVAAAMNLALQERGLEPRALAIYRRFVGEGVERLVTLLLGEAADPALIVAVAEGYRRIYPARMLLQSQPYPGVRALLAALQARGVPLAVLSNKPHVDTRAMVEALFPGVFLEQRVIGQRADRPRKPDPTVALQLAAELNVAPESCLFVGDTPVDVRTAQAAGMWPIGVAWGFRPLDELIGLGAVPVADPAEILGLLHNPG